MEKTWLCVLSVGSDSMTSTFIGLAISSHVSKDRIFDESVSAVFV
jgi:hypothetical protein